MTGRPRLGRWLSRPQASLALLAWLTGLLVQTGSFGTVDTWRRYQVTRWLWRGEPAVAPGDYPAFGIPGTGGQIHAWYAVGQSVVMLPADLLAAALTRFLPVTNTLRHQLDAAIVAFATFPIIAAANVALAYRVLRCIGRFDRKAAALGTLAWLFGTTVLTYMQLHFENSLDLCLSLVAALGAFAWATSGRRAPLAAAAIATGLDVLVRVTNGCDGALLLGFALLSARPTTGAAQATWWRSRARDLAVVWLPILVTAFALDRAYQVSRFGWENLTTTYIELYGLRERARNPSLPPNFPFSEPFLRGLLTSLSNHNRSALLFDPLAVLAAVLALRALWRRRPLGTSARASDPRRQLWYFAAAAATSFALRMVMYARYFHREGGVCWSDRFVLVPVELVALLSVPLLLDARPSLSRPWRAAAGVVLAAAVTLATASIIVDPNLETMQSFACHRPANVLPDRLANVVREVVGVDRAGLSCQDAIPESYLRPALLPFGNGRDLPKAAQKPVLFAWLVLLGAFLFVLLRELRSATATSRRAR